MRLICIENLSLKELQILKIDYEIKLDDTIKKLDYHEKKGLTFRDKYDELVDDEFDLTSEIEKIQIKIDLINNNGLNT